MFGTLRVNQIGNHQIIAMVSRHKWSEKYSWKVFFCDLDWVIEYFCFMFFLNLENFFFWNVNESWLKENVSVIEGRVKAYPFVGYVKFSSDYDITLVSTIELIQKLLVFSHGNVFLFDEPFFSLVVKFGFEFRFHWLIQLNLNEVLRRYFL